MTRIAPKKNNNNNTRQKNKNKNQNKKQKQKQKNGKCILQNAECKPTWRKFWRVIILTSYLHIYLHWYGKTWSMNYRTLFFSLSTSLSTHILLTASIENRESPVTALPGAQFLIVTQRGIVASSFGHQFIELIV